MISPHTPPGTHVVVVWATDVMQEALYKLVHRQYWPIFYALYPGGFTPPFKVGDRYTVKSIRPCAEAKQGYVVTLAEMDGAWGLPHFDVAVLPKALTDLLVGKDVPADTMELV